MNFDYGNLYLPKLSIFPGAPHPHVEAHAAGRVPGAFIYHLLNFKR